jgi:arsenate reductase (glutaredoxin)
MDRGVSMLKVYTLANCDSCRAATKWLAAREFAFEEHAIRETPPSLSELNAALAAYGGEVRKLFNSSGRDYRAENIAERLGRMSTDEALQLLASNGNLVKRPFVVGDGVALVGFHPDTWAEIFAKA